MSVIPHIDVKYFDGSGPYEDAQRVRRAVQRCGVYAIRKAVSVNTRRSYSRVRLRLGDNASPWYGFSTLLRKFESSCYGTLCDSIGVVIASQRLKRWGEALRGCLSLTLSGFGFASHDIGGFEVCVSSDRT